jgi:hypothetical protein
MKTIKAEATATKTASTIEFKEELKGLTKDQRREVLDQIGELLVEQILDAVGDQKSPVTGNAFKPLSLEYSKRKKDEVGNTRANLDLFGDMLSSVDYKIRDEKLEIGVFGSEAPKADGHNNISGDSKIPTRRFIPAQGQDFTAEIKGLIKETVDQYKAENLRLKKKDLKEIQNTDELYRYLKGELGDMSRASLKQLVLSSELAVSLDEFDLLELL